MRVAVLVSLPSLALTLGLTSAGSWSTAAPIPARVQEHHGALLDGQIYIAGGFDSSDAPTRVAFRYDPGHDAWARIADLPEDRHHMPLVVVGDTLYAVGGLEGQQFVPQTTLWIYRADRNTWETRAPLPAPRGASAAAVVNGKIVVVGGFGTHRALLDSITVYDPAANRWTNRAPIPTRRDHLTAEAEGGMVYAIGGRPLDPGRNYDVVEAYDLAADRWTTKSPMPSRRGGLASAVLAGRIHTFGGERLDGVFANHEVYDPAHDAWTVAAPMPTARHGLAAVTVGDRIFVIGGGPKAGSAQTSVVEVWR
jgi:N-acetylneuraminic acid mutarotase